MLAYGFAQRALLGGLLIAATCSIMSFFIIVRRLAFAGVGVSHAAFGGVAIGVAAGVNPILTAGGFCVLVAGGIGWFSRKGRLHEDTVIGILFAASMALGVLLMSFADAYNQDLLSYLFGSILAMSWTDVVVIAVMTVLSIGFLVLFFKELLFLSFDEETATASGIPVRFVYYGLLVTMALTIVVSIKLVGIVLVSALLVIPGAIGLQLCRNYRAVLVTALVASLASVTAGLFLSFHFDVPSGATMVMVQFVLFVLAFALSPRRTYISRFRRRAGEGEPAGGRLPSGGSGD